MVGSSPHSPSEIILARCDRGHTPRFRCTSPFFSDAVSLASWSWQRTCNGALRQLDLSALAVVGSLVWMVDTHILLSFEVFHQANQQYVVKKLRQGRVDEHWQVMLDELLEDRARGRLDGPFAAPDGWPVPAVGLPDEALQPLPDKEIYAAFCFSVCQSDKVRRCEDDRRSHHNETVQVWDPAS